jgi:hypothetical protein
MDLPNLPLPDQLAEVRAEIKRLEERESALKSLLLSDPETRTGVSWIAEVKTVETSRVDLKELRAMHKDLVEEYTFPQKTVRIELSGVSSDGEIIPARRFRNAMQA